MAQQGYNGFAGQQAYGQGFGYPQNNGVAPGMGMQMTPQQMQYQQMLYQQQQQQMAQQMMPQMNQGFTPQQGGMSMNTAMSMPQTTMPGMAKDTRSEEQRRRDEQRHRLQQLGKGKAKALDPNDIMATMSFAPSAKGKVQPKPDADFGGFTSASAGDFGSFSAGAVPKSHAASNYAALEELRETSSVFETPKAALPAPGNVFGKDSTGNVFGGSAAPIQQATMAQTPPSQTPAVVPTPPTYTFATQSPLGLVEAVLIPPGTMAPQSREELERVKSRRQTFSVSSQDSALGTSPSIPPQFHQWRQSITQDSQGRYPGVQVAGLLRSANLEQAALKRVWDKADRDRQGSLTQEQLFNAFALVALAQAGQEPTLTALQALPIYPIPQLYAANAAPAPAPAADDFGSFAASQPTNSAPVAAPTLPTPRSTMDDSFGDFTAGVAGPSSVFGAFDTPTLPSKPVSVVATSDPYAAFADLTGNTSSSQPGQTGTFAALSSATAASAPEDSFGSLSSSNQPILQSPAFPKTEAVEDDFGSFTAPVSNQAANDAFGSFETRPAVADISFSDLRTQRTAQPASTDRYAAFSELSVSDTAVNDQFGSFDQASSSHASSDRYAALQGVGAATLQQPLESARAALEFIPSANAAASDEFGTFSSTAPTPAATNGGDDFGSFNAALSEPAAVQKNASDISFTDLRAGSSSSDPYAAFASLQPTGDSISFGSLVNEDSAAKEQPLQPQDPYAAFSALAADTAPKHVPLSAFDSPASDDFGTFSSIAPATNGDDFGSFNTAFPEPVAVQKNASDISFTDLRAGSSSSDPYAAFASLQPSTSSSQQAPFLDGLSETAGVEAASSAPASGFPAFSAFEGASSTDQDDFGSFNTANIPVDPVTAFPHVTPQPTQGLSPTFSTPAIQPSPATSSEFANFASSSDNAEFAAFASSSDAFGALNGGMDMPATPSSTDQDVFGAFDKVPQPSAAGSDIYSAFAELSGQDDQKNAVRNSLLEKLLCELQLCLKWLDKAQEHNLVSDLRIESKVADFFAGCLDLLRLAKRLAGHEAPGMSQQVLRISVMVQEILPPDYQQRLQQATEQIPGATSKQCSICDHVVDEDSNDTGLNNAAHHLMGKTYHVSCANFWNRHVEGMLP